MIKAITPEELMCEISARSIAKLHCDQALANTVKTLLAKDIEINQDAPEFSAAFSAELSKIGKSAYGESPYLVGRYIAGGLMAETKHDVIEPFSIVITSEQITKEICWQQHPASRKGTYL